MKVNLTASWSHLLARSLQEINNNLNIIPHGMAISCRLNGYRAYKKIFNANEISIRSKGYLHVISFYERIFFFLNIFKEYA